MNKKKQIAVHGSIIIALSLMGWVIRELSFPDKFDFESHLNASLLSVFIITFLWIALLKINTFLDKKTPYSKGIQKRITVQLLLSLAVIYSFLTIIIFILVPSFVKVIPEREVIFGGYMVYFFINIAANAAIIGHHFFIEWKKSLLREETLELEKTQALFDNLKNQINPHFLFNSLSSLNGLIFENPHLASKFLKQLSKVYRYLLENDNNQPVTLQTEITFVQNYILLLQTRFEGGLIVNLNINEEEKLKKIIPVTLQVLIENAVKHNSTFADSPLVIDIYVENGYLVVKNNMQAKTRVEGSNKKGLDNLVSLYYYTTSKEAHILNIPPFFLVQIPLIH